MLQNGWGTRVGVLLPNVGTVTVNKQAKEALDTLAKALVELSITVDPI